jgi:hypothetical protein
VEHKLEQPLGRRGRKAWTTKIQQMPAKSKSEDRVETRCIVINFETDVS